LFSEEDNISKLLLALKDFGFGSLDLKMEDFLDSNQIIQLGFPPNRIDLLTEILGVNFKSCFEKKVQIMIDDVPVNFIDLENLKKNKKATGSHQDLADLENLQ